MPNISIKLDESKGTKNVTFPWSNKVILGSSCTENNECSPYTVKFPPGSYIIDCYGASGTDIENDFSMGGHTFGTISLQKTTKFYIYIGQMGHFNGPKTFGGGGIGNIGNIL